MVIINTGRNCGFNIEGLKSAITVHAHDALVWSHSASTSRPTFFSQALLNPAPILNTPDGQCLPESGVFSLFLNLPLNPTARCDSGSCETGESYVLYVCIIGWSCLFAVL